MDFSEMTDTELESLSRAVEAELRRRGAEAAATAAIDQALSVYADTAGLDRGEGEAWVQPVGAHDSYPSGAIVAHGGKTWESLVTANVHEPSISGWRIIPEDGEAAEWVRPSGSHDSYMTGDLVIFEGAVYQSTIDANTWSITEYPQGWALIEDAEAPDDEEPTEPEPSDEEPDALEWVAPDGAHNAYQTGDRVTFEGSIYESKIDANVWRPDQHPAGWGLIG